MQWLLVVHRELMSWRRLTCVEGRLDAVIRLPKPFTLVKSPLGSRAVLDIRIVWVRHIGWNGFNPSAWDVRPYIYRLNDDS